MFFVQDDQAKLLYGSKNSTPRTDDDLDLTARYALPLQMALRRAQMTMQDRYIL